MSEAIFLEGAGQQPYTAGSALLSGAIVQLTDGRAAVVKSDLASGDKGAVYTRGIMRILKATGTTFAAGVPVYWDTSADLAITTPGAADDLYLGTAVVVAGSELYVDVDLNEGLAGAGSLANRGAFATRQVLLAHDDTDEHILVTAAENPMGLMVMAFAGVVDEAPAGSSEDQLVLDLSDEDDNVLSQITTTDTTPDAAGDVVIGTRTTEAGATGDVAALIPAGKAAYVNVSQATAGTPAGEVTVGAILVPWG